MRAFAELLGRLSFTASRNAKLTLVRDFLKTQPDPERGWALAALTGELVFQAAKPAMIRKAVEARMDPVLFAWSYDYVGDLAETVALVWPKRPGANREPELSEVVDALHSASRTEVPRLLEGWLDALDADGRWALLKLMTGGLRAERPTRRPPVISFSRAQRPSASSASSQPSSSRGTSVRDAARRASTTSERSGSRLAPGRAGQTRATVSARSPT